MEKSAAAHCDAMLYTLSSPQNKYHTAQAPNPYRAWVLARGFMCPPGHTAVGTPVINGRNAPRILIPDPAACSDATEEVDFCAGDPGEWTRGVHPLLRGHEPGPCARSSPSLPPRPRFARRRGNPNGADGPTQDLIPPAWFRHWPPLTMSLGHFTVPPFLWLTLCRLPQLRN